MVYGVCIYMYIFLIYKHEDPATANEFVESQGLWPVGFSCLSALLGL